MSPLNIQKTAAIAPAAGVASGARSPAGERVASASPRALAAPREGVSVELSGQVRPAAVPVDQDRVAEIRAALQDGSYPVVPTEIADAMIAARLMLGFGE